MSVATVTPSGATELKKAKTTGKTTKYANAMPAYQGFDRHFSKTTEKSRFFIKGDKKYHQIASEDILFIEAYGNYTKVFFDDEMIIILDALRIGLKGRVRIFNRIHDQAWSVAAASDVK